PPQGLQQKPAFIEKYQASLPFGPLFLAVATRPGAIVRWRLYSFRGRDVRVPERSNQVAVKLCPRNRRGSSPGTIGESALSLAGSSIPVKEIPSFPRRHSKPLLNADD